MLTAQVDDNTGVAMYESDDIIRRAVPGTHRYGAITSAPVSHACDNFPHGVTTCSCRLLSIMTACL